VELRKRDMRLMMDLVGLRMGEYWGFWSVLRMVLGCESYFGSGGFPCWHSLRRSWTKSMRREMRWK